jgi:signal transduction histidine kinase
MIKGNFMGLRARLLLLVLLPTVPALFLALYTNLEERHFGKAKVGKEALKTVEVVAAGQNGLLEGTRGHLLGFAKFPAAFGTNYSTFQRFFSQLRNLYPDYVDFGVAETNGSLISSAYGLKGRTNVSDQVYFQRVLRTGGLSVGEYQPATPFTKASLLIGHPLQDTTGHLVRVVYGALDLDVINRMLALTSLPEGGISQVFDSGGNIIARYPDGQNWVGKSCRDSDLFATISRQLEGNAEMVGLDGIPRLYAFTTLRSGTEPGLFLTVGIPASVAYSETKQMLWVNLMILGGVAALTLLAAWIYGDRYILHPIKALLSSARRVGAGDLSARTGIANVSSELQQLVKAFDEMATNLQQQRGEMERAHAEIARLNETLEGRVAERTAQLAEVNRQLEAFSYSVSHDLRAPLRHMSAYIELLKSESGATFTEESHHFLNQIAEAIDRMNGLVGDLLAFARMAREEVRRENVSMTQLVSDVQREMKRDTEGRNIRWNIEPLPEVFVDRAMFKQVWANLLSNAIKYTRERESAEITVGSTNGSNEIQFFVRDNGAGFDMKYADKLFGVFQRLHAPEQFEGTGIGLANVQRIVVRHGGKTWAEGEVNRGATFWFSIPKTAK